MKKYIDYFYYRVYKCYSPKTTTREFRAIMAVCLLEEFLFIWALVLFQHVIFNNLQRGELLFKIIAMLMVPCLMVFNHHVYKGKIEEFDIIWGNETKLIRRAKGWLIVFSTLILLLAMKFTLSHFIWKHV